MGRSWKIGIQVSSPLEENSLELCIILSLSGPQWEGGSVDQSGNQLDITAFIGFVPSASSLPLPYRYFQDPPCKQTTFMQTLVLELLLGKHSLTQW